MSLGDITSAERPFPPCFVVPGTGGGNHTESSSTGGNGFPFAQITNGDRLKFSGHVETL